jgi:hypothetical protein
VECVGAVFIAGLLSVIVIGGLVLNKFNRREHEESLRALAQRRSLHLEAGSMFQHPVLRGYLNDVGVVLDVLTKKQGKSTVHYTRATARTRVAMPDRMELHREDVGTFVSQMFGGQDIEIGDERLDELWRVRGRVRSDVVSLLQDSDAKLVCETLAEHRLNHMQPNQVVLHSEGRLKEEGAEALLERAAELAQRLTDARLRPWREASERCGMTMELSHDEVTLQGDIEGFTVHIRGDLKQGSTVVRVRCAPGLPAGLLVTEGEGGGLGDPILDRMVQVQAQNLADARPILLDEHVHGDLLAVVHAYPGSSLTQDHIDMALPWATSSALLDRIDDAVKLGVSLRSACQNRSNRGVAPRKRSKT